MSNFQEALKQIKRGNIESIYLLYGTETYFIEQCKKALIDTVSDGEDSGALTTYDLLETPIQDVITDVETIPFFTERKIIMAENAIFLKSKQEKIPFEHHLTALETYLDHQVDYSVLVLIAPYEKLDERKKITKQLKKNVTVVNCNPIKHAGVKKWIEQLAHEYKITMTDGAIEWLEVEFQDQLQLLQNEVEKLALYVGDGGEVSKEIAANVISTSLNHDALELVDAVLKRDLLKTIQINKELQIRKEEPIGLIALLAYQFRIIFQVKLLKQKGYPNHRIQSELKVHPYVVKLASQRSAAFTEQMLKKIMNELTETDAKIKQGKMDKDIAFELLLYKLTAIK